MIFGGVASLISSVVAADLGDSSHGKYNAKTTVVGIIDGSGGIGAGVGQIIIGILQKISWNSVFYFVFAVNACAVLAMIPLVVRAVKAPIGEENIEAEIEVT